MIESRRDKQMERKNSKHIKEVDVKKIWVFDNGKETEIPAEDKREKLIYDCRVEFSHKCRTTVYYELRKKYCWPGIKDHIYQVIKGGEICQKYNRKTSRDSIFIATSRYLEKVSMDMIEFREKKCVVVVAVDYFYNKNMGKSTGE